MRVITAYVSRNALPPDRLGALIETMHVAIGKLAMLPPRKTIAPSDCATAEAPSPLLIRSSITPAGLTSFEDGRVYRTLRRHLRSRGLDPETYRSKWGLPPDYPMTCPAYSERRSAIARENRLGHVLRT